MVILRVWDIDNWKNISESEFPLAIGLPPEGGILFSHSVASPVAWIGFNNHQLFVQPAGAEVSVQINAEKIDGPQWLVQKDTIKIDNAACKLTIDSGVFVLSPSVTAAAAPPAPSDTSRTAPAQTQKNTPLRNTQKIVPPTLPKNEQARHQPKPAREPSFDRLQTGRVNRRVRNAILICFVLLLLSVVFVLTAVPVRMTITPTPDTTSLSRLPLSIKVWERYLVVPGTYHVYAEKEGYRKLDESITVGFGSNLTYEYTLRKLPGLLDIATRPIDNATVSIDKAVIGTTPLTAIKLEEGSHTISIMISMII
jgi:hypothetical protein